jgi:hypothetical protein
LIIWFWYITLWLFRSIIITVLKKTQIWLEINNYTWSIYMIEWQLPVKFLQGCIYGNHLWLEGKLIRKAGMQWFEYEP